MDVEGIGLVHGGEGTAGGVGKGLERRAKALLTEKGAEERVDNEGKEKCIWGNLEWVIRLKDHISESHVQGLFRGHFE